MSSLTLGRFKAFVEDNYDFHMKLFSQRNEMKRVSCSLAVQVERLMSSERGRSRLLRVMCGLSLSLQ